MDVDSSSSSVFIFWFHLVAFLSGTRLPAKGAGCMQCVSASLPFFLNQDVSPARSHRFHDGVGSWVFAGPVGGLSGLVRQTAAELAGSRGGGHLGVGEKAMSHMQCVRRVGEGGLGRTLRGDNGWFGA